MVDELQRTLQDFASSTVDTDFRFFRLTFRFFNDCRFLCLSSRSAFLSKWSITSISTLMLEVGSWMTVVWGTVTGCNLTAWPALGGSGRVGGKTEETGSGQVGRLTPGQGKLPAANVRKSYAVFGCNSPSPLLLFSFSTNLLLLEECLSISLYTRLSRSMKSTLLFDLFVIVDLRKVLDDNSELHCSVVGWVA